MKSQKQINSKYSAMMLAVLFYLFIIAFYNNTYAGQQGKTTISVYGLKSIGISQSLASSLQEHLESNLLKYEQYDVMSRNNIDVILKESRFQQTGMCSEEECLVEAGNILGVEKIITGTISMVGSTYNVVLKMIDVGTAKLESSVNQKHSGNIDTLLDVIEISLHTLLGEIQKNEKEMEKQREMEQKENTYKENLEKLKAERAELKAKTADFRERWVEEKNNTAQLKQLHYQQEDKIQELEEAKHVYELYKGSEVDQDTVVQVASVSSDDENLSSNGGYSAKKGFNGNGESKKGKKVGIGAVIVLGIVGVSVLVFQLLGAN